MAHYLTGFSEYMLGATPTGWTRRWYLTNAQYYPTAVADAADGVALRFYASNNNNHRLITKDDVNADANRLNSEVLLKFKQSTTTGDIMHVLQRASGALASAVGYRFYYYDGNIGIDALLGTSATDIISAPFTLLANTYYWVRFRVNGTSLKAKIWVNGESEPSTWTLESTDSRNITVGWIGIGGYTAGASYTYYDFVSFATNGETALAALISAPTITTNIATNVGETTSTLNGQITETGNQDPTRYFEYGLTTAYGTILNKADGGVGAYSHNLSGLQIGTTYHYRAYAINSGGTTYGLDQTFTTLTPMYPLPTTQSPINNIKILSTEANVFLWQVNETATQTHFEIRHRIAGTPTWITTGAIASSITQYTIMGGVIATDANLEWQVKSWDSAESSRYDWSTVALFSTLNPPIISDVNTPDESKIEMGSYIFTAKITSPYGRDCLLGILISSNIEFTDPVSNETSLFDSGGVGAVQSTFSSTGDFYVKLIAEDINGIKSEQVIGVKIIQTLFFITEPSVNIQGPQATHVTVRIKDSNPVIEYTSYVTPEPMPDKIIDRLVEIDTGTVATCQTVAEQLVERWGREQKSIRGEVNLTVTLSFMRRVHIIDQQSGIDGEFILQQKEHDIISMRTTLTLGDILLNDNEFLARIIDELIK